MSSSRERFRSITDASRKKVLRGDFKIIFVILIAGALLMVFMAPGFKMEKMLGSALSKKNKGIILNYLYWSPQSVIEVLGEPDSEQKLRDNEHLRYWNYDPVTLEIHFFQDKASRIAFATQSTMIRDHLEDQILEVFGRMEDWKQARRTIDGEPKIVFINRPGRMTVVKYESSVMVYNYLFPESL